MATDPPSSPQRAYRAACPNCGAPVEFRSAASAFAVCSFCRSTIVRDGEALRKIGESAELFDDHSPLQLGASGKYQGAAFTLVGRLQYRYKDGTWNEWHALFEGDGAGAVDAGTGRSGWLAEDNGRYVLSFDAPLVEAAPPSQTLRVGQSLIVGGQSWSVASVSAAKLIAAQGELPRPPNTERGFIVADLRNTRGEVGTLDYQSADAPVWSVGRSVALSELALRGLAESSEKTLQGRSVECPSCGTSLDVKLSSTQSVACHQCHAVIDLSKNVGADLAHYAQENGSEPQIPLGSIGRLSLNTKPGAPPLAWQVVGYAERCEVGEDEQSFWREYLLYHRQEGFAFLVDAQDGWSWATPITGVPEKFGESVKLNGVLYKKLYDYTGKSTYVLGEFYWQLRRDELTHNSDFIGTGTGNNLRLNREQTGDEITWSSGSTLTADQVMQAFKLAPDKRASLQRDAKPNALGGSSLVSQIVLWSVVIIVLLILYRCDGSNNDCSQVRATYGEASTEYRDCRTSSGSYRTSGGSWGGYSSGGGHK